VPLGPGPFFRNVPNIDTDIFRAAFLGNLQRAQDFVRACEAGLDCLTPTAFEQALPKGSLIPAPDLQLEFDGARDFARYWLARTFFRDVVDYVQDYLDHAYDVCSFVEAIGKQAPPEAR